MIEFLQPLTRAWRAWRGTRKARLEALASAPFPARWAALLRSRSAHYRRLPGAHRQAFERQLQIFVSETRVTGVEMEVTDDLRVLVAASAVSLTAGWPAYTWDQTSEVLLYPSDFDHDYQFGSGIAGQAHQWGVVILSIPALHRGFDVPEEGHHVGYHEFAHLLDLSRGSFDGVPSYLGMRATDDWLALVDRERVRLRRGDSIIDPYALSGMVEFFPTTVEAFLQRPESLRRHHPELYGFLAEYFQQDPAAWVATS
jgi:Mlc titration factor MtfA (ptsG expression regulator)